MGTRSVPHEPTYPVGELNFVLEKSTTSILGIMTH